MSKKYRYPQPYSMKDYDGDDVRDRVHNSIKHNGEADPLKKYQVYLKPLRRRKNKHKTREFI